MTLERHDGDVRDVWVVWAFSQWQASSSLPGAFRRDRVTHVCGDIECHRERARPVANPRKQGGLCEGGFGLDLSEDEFQVCTGYNEWEGSWSEQQAGEYEVKPTQRRTLQGSILLFESSRTFEETLKCYINDHVQSAKESDI